MTLMSLRHLAVLCLQFVASAAPLPLERQISRLRLRRRIRNRERLVPPEGLTRTYREAMSLVMERRGGRPLGDYLEFGVFNGTSLLCMHEVREELGATEVRLFGFDSFEGLPPDCIDEKSPWAAGQFSSAEDFTRAVLTNERVDWSRVFLVRGRFSDSLKPDVVRHHRIERCSVIMVDCDLYASAQQALAFCGPLITDDAVIVFDDWPADETGYQGENVAFDEFLEANPHLSASRLDLAYSPNSAVFLVERRTQ